MSKQKHLTIGLYGKEKLKTNKHFMVYQPGRDYDLFKGPIMQFFDLIQYRHVVRSLIVHRLTQRYHGSSLGIAWTLISPLITMISLAIIIPLIAKFQMPNYAIFLFSGVIIWWTINASILSGGDSILNSEDLIKKVYFPRIIFPFAHVTIELINLFISFVALFILGLTLGLEIKPNFLYLIVSIAVSYFFCLGLGFIMSILNVHFRDLKHVTGVVLQAIFYISAIIFPADMVPDQHKYLIMLNPFFYFVNLFQIAIYDPSNAYWSKFAVSFGISLVTFWMGLVVQWLFSKRIVYHL